MVNDNDVLRTFDADAFKAKKQAEKKVYVLFYNAKLIQYMGVFSKPEIAENQLNIGKIPVDSDRIEEGFHLISAIIDEEI
jgi:hypothetical protein